MSKKFFICIVFALCAGCSIKKTENTSPLWVKRIDPKFSSITEEGGKHPSIIQFTDEKTHLTGFKEKNGAVIIPAQYQAVYDFNSYGIADVFDIPDRSWHKITTNKTFLVKSYLIDCGPDYYVSGLSRFEQNGKLGFVNIKGEIVIPPKFDWTTGFWFSEPIALVCLGCTEQKADQNGYSEIKGGKWGGIDKKGHLVIPLEFTGYTLDDNHAIILFKNSTAHKIFRDKHNRFQVIKNDDTF